LADLIAKEATDDRFEVLTQHLPKFIGCGVAIDGSCQPAAGPFKS